MKAITAKKELYKQLKIGMFHSNGDKWSTDAINYVKALIMNDMVNECVIGNLDELKPENYKINKDVIDC